jgi:predicted RNase H-like HicB family nuclease
MARLADLLSNVGLFLPSIAVRFIIIVMKKFTAIVHRGEPEEGGFWATCLEVPGANGQGETREECLANLKEAIQLLLDTEREEVFRLDPQAETEELVLS